MLEQGALKVTVVRGVGLLAADKGGTSDPYVVVQLGKTKKRSKVIKKTLDPEWNEALTFDGIGMRELVESQLLVRAFDYDGITSRNDTLGARRVSVELLHTVTYRYAPLCTVTSRYTPSHTVTCRHIPSLIALHAVTHRYTPLQASSALVLIDSEPSTASTTRSRSLYREACSSPPSGCPSLRARPASACRNLERVWRRAHH